MHYHPKGFTLIEAMVAVSVIALLVAIAIPAWSNTVAAVHSSHARGAMATSLMDSIRHATARNTEVVLCPVSSVATCIDTADWSRGWMAFADVDGNRARGENEPVVRRESALEGGVRLRSTPGRTRIVFQPDGSNGGSNVTFTLCDRRGPSKASTLVLANDGRLRQGTPTSAAAQACVHS